MMTGPDPAPVDVVVLSWPGEQEEIARLAIQRRPRLLLVDRDARPPEVEDILEDWVRLPCDDRDVEARLQALRHRALKFVARPTGDGHGGFSYAGISVYLTHIDQALACLLADHFGTAVPQDELAACGWPGQDIAPGTLRAHLYRLRDQFRPLGLSLHSVRQEGWVLHATPVRQSIGLVDAPPQG